VQIITLKAASVVGDVFNLKQLMHITPVRGIEEERMIEILGELEQNELIEIIDGDKDDWSCRFRRAFLRETLY
jgi:hypothetical protein